MRLKQIVITTLTFLVFSCNSTVLKNEESNLVAQMLDQIGKDCKQILLFFYFEKNKMSEIANKMNLANEQVAKNKKSNCMKKLKSFTSKETCLKQKLRLKRN